MDRSDDETRREGATGGIECPHPLDPIARNDEDVDKPEEGAHATEVRRREEVTALAANTAFVPDSLGRLSPHAQAAVSGAGLLTSVLRFKWTLFVVFVLVAAPIIAAVWTQVIPKYRARAEVRVRPIIPRLVFRMEDNGMIPLYQSFVNTQVSLVRSVTVLQRVLDQPGLQETQWYKDPPRSYLQRLRGDPDPPMERLKDSLSVQPRPQTEIIDVSFLASSAREAPLIVDALLEQYIKYIGEKSDATEDRLYRQLAEQYRSLLSEIEGREKVCAELRKSLGTGIPEELISSRRVRLDEMQARLSELQQNIAILEWEIKQATTDDGNDVAVASVDGTDGEPQYYEDAEWRRLDLDVRTIQHRIANSVYGPSHPDGIRAQEDLKFAEELLRLREAQLDEQRLSRPRNTAGALITTANASGAGYEEGLIVLEHQLARAKCEEQLLQDEHGAQRRDFEGLFTNAQLLEDEHNALAHKRELFDAVRQRLDQKTMERNVPGSIEVLMWAYAASRPHEDRRVVFTAMALFVGLGMGGGAAFLRASRSQTITTPKDMPQPMQVPFLGHVPLIRYRKAPGRALCDELERNQLFLVESIRVMRTALLSRLNGRASASVLITSAMAGTGKSSFTKILGKSMAQAGKKVLMIDADFYKMTLSKWSDLLDRPGLMDSLRCRSVDRRFIFPANTSGLSIMPVGERGDADVVFDEIANGAFRACMDQLSRQYNFDIILLDSSPLLPVADATILAGQVDGTIMVERENISRRANVTNALGRLSSTGGRLLGTVFVGSGGREDYGYAYNHYCNRTRES